jgi:hypothetical protein
VNTLTRALVIFEAVPEATTIYDLELDPMSDEFKNLWKCHGEYGNLANNEQGHPVDTWLYEWLATKLDNIIFSTEKDWQDANKGKIKPIEINSNIILIHTGAMM